ncbi:MAG: helical backbone metal receptor [Treponema sp.]|nr:helical backbone metal receptor [Treponema sp.]
MFLLLFAFLTVPCHAVLLTDVWGRTIAFEKPAERIISLSPSVTEIFYALNAENTVAGRTDYCNYPPRVKNVPSVGGFAGATINVEHIILLNPDIVILSGTMHLRINGILESLGIRTFAVEPHSYKEILYTIEQLAIISGHEKDAQTLIQTMNTKIQQAKNIRAGKSIPRVLWILTEEPFMTVGASSFINEIIELGGGLNIFHDLTEEYPFISAEHVVLRAPQWILTGSDRPTIHTWLKNKTVFASLEAVRVGRIAWVDADTVYRYGPRFADAVLNVARILNP